MSNHISQQSATHIERLVRDPVDSLGTSGGKDLAHGRDKVLRWSGKVSVITLNLGFNVEQDGLVGRTFDEFKHFGKSRDFRSGHDL